MLKHFAFFILIFCTPSLALCLPPQMRFESAEHISLGDQIKLKFEEEPSNKTSASLLHLPNGLTLTYGEISALGGDFYGDPDHPISLSRTSAEARSRFAHAFSSLAKEWGAVNEAPKLLSVIKEEINQLYKGLQNGSKPAEIYKHVALDHIIAWNCITGGLCRDDYPQMSDSAFQKIYFLQPGRYLRLGDKNFDHFGLETWHVYKVGHELALEKAIMAGKNHNRLILEEAYAINAFACHYLADGFSSGHMRTPRLFLSSKVSPAALGTILSVYMHNEDDESGLMVSNRRGDTWQAFGDRYYINPKNQTNLEILKEALQISADEIYEAYLSGYKPQTDKLAELIPNLNKLMKRDSKENTAPLFYWDTRYLSLMRRKEVDNERNYEWSAFWLGWETLGELVEAKGPLPEAEGQFPPYI